MRDYFLFILRPTSVDHNSDRTCVYLRINYQKSLRVSVYLAKILHSLKLKFFNLNISTHGLDFLEFRLWVGLWTALLLFLLVMFNLSFLAKFITRFSEECFAGLVSIVFILDALKMTGRLHKAPKQPFGQEVLTANNFSFLKTNISTSVACIGDDMIDSVFHFSILLFIMTLMMCMLLSKIRTKRYLTTKVRICFFTCNGLDAATRTILKIQTFLRRS